MEFIRFESFFLSLLCPTGARPRDLGGGRELGRRNTRRVVDLPAACLITAGRCIPIQLPGRDRLLFSLLFSLPSSLFIPLIYLHNLFASLLPSSYFYTSNTSGLPHHPFTPSIPPYYSIKQLAPLPPLHRYVGRFSSWRENRQ